MSYQLTQHKYLLPPELDHLKNSLAKGTSRDQALIQLLLSTGARANEALNVRGCDLNDSAGSVHIKGLKNSNDREIPLPVPLFNALKKLRTQDNGAKLFPISYDRLYQIWNHWRPVDKTIHSLRHTFAIELYRRTRDLRLVQVALGHRNINNTMVYANYVYSQEELRKVLVG